MARAVSSSDASAISNHWIVDREGGAFANLHQLDARVIGARPTAAGGSQVTQPVTGATCLYEMRWTIAATAGLHESDALLASRGGSVLTTGSAPALAQPRKASGTPIATGVVGISHRLTSADCRVLSASVRMLELAQCASMLRVRRFELVTRGAHAPAAVSAAAGTARTWPGVAFASAWGILRTAAAELPQVQCVDVDVDASAGATALTSATRRAPRLARARCSDRDCYTHKRTRRQLPRRAERARHVPRRPGPPGADCAGVAVSVSPLAPRAFHAGESLLGLAPGCLGSHARTSVYSAARKPDVIAFSAAATTPTVFVTVDMALSRATEATPESRVLVQETSGGVGLAALEVLRTLGAHVVGTAGGPRKRALLRDRGVCDALDTRRTAYADEIHALTITEVPHERWDVEAGPESDLELKQLFGSYLRNALLWTDTACPQLNHHVEETTADAQKAVERTKGVGVATFLILEKQRHLASEMAVAFKADAAARGDDVGGWRGRFS
ncbi:polyketide synthase [Pseudoscourfieldia marina]